MLRLAASAVLKQIVAPQTSMPTHAGGFFVSRYCGAIRFSPAGAYGTSMPSASKMARLVAATPMTTSAFGLAFSASKRAVMTPVESRTQVILIPGFAFSKAV
jgi:hypothetical protein